MQPVDSHMSATAMPATCYHLHLTYLLVFLLGGRGVIDEIEKQLALSKDMIDPSRSALFRYGNVSSSSIWYVLAFIETFRGVKKGDRIWQLGFGSGFKCNSAVWKANRRVKVSYHRQRLCIQAMYCFKCVSCTPYAGLVLHALSSPNLSTQACTSYVFCRKRTMLGMDLISTTCTESSQGCHEIADRVLAWG